MKMRIKIIIDVDYKVKFLEWLKADLAHMFDIDKKYIQISFKEGRNEYNIL